MAEMGVTEEDVREMAERLKSAAYETIAPLILRPPH